MGIFDAILLLFAVSQLYWFWRGWVWMSKRVRARAIRAVVAAAALAAYLLLFNFEWLTRRATPVRLTPTELLFGAPFSWWMASSLFSFLLLLLFWGVTAVIRAPLWAARKARGHSPDPSRRAFLARTGNVVAAAPFLGGAYGLLYGRLNLETPRQPIRLPRLPRAFDGFRIAQLSDIHIGPFMTEEEIRKFVGIANALKPDLVVLTGDFVTWDSSPQQAVVRALSGLRAPFGVFGCLGNHDAWARVEGSITALFAQVGIRILRHQNVAITSGGESFNLMGIDFASRRQMGPHSEAFVQRFFNGLGGLMAPDRVNILLSHNPDTFDRAAEMGIDLSLAGHTHGGQAALEFISPQIAPSRLVTPYVSGLFEKPGGQLYVNRGIGTIGVPIRIGAPPEITLFELKRG
ncbi:MAG: metallophosphoesterase [Acidobacteriia bacterium]|nr:metallophosphoesterase [Terriglobia bacterium]